MKKLVLYQMMSLAMFSFGAASCGTDEEDVSNDQYVVTIDSDGKTSSSVYFVPINDKNFYINGVLYTIINGHMEVDGFDKDILPTKVNIISELNYKGMTFKVNKIRGCAFQECRHITEVVIPAGIVSIGAWAFKECNSLKSVTISNTVETIGEWAFWGDALESIIIPNSVSVIGAEAFTGCMSLTHAKVPARFKDITYKDLYSPGSRYVSFQESVFKDCKNLKKIEYY